MSSLEADQLKQENLEQEQETLKQEQENLEQEQQNVEQKEENFKQQEEDVQEHQEDLQQKEEDNELPPTIGEDSIEDDEPTITGDVEPVSDEGHLESGNDESFNADNDFNVDNVNNADNFDNAEDNKDKSPVDATDSNSNSLVKEEDDLEQIAEEESGEQNENAYPETDVYSMRSHKDSSGDVTRKKKIRKSANEMTSNRQQAEVFYTEESYGTDLVDYSNEDPATRKRRLLEEKMDQAVKNKTLKRRKADEDDLERMQDDRIDLLKNKMIEAANLDVEKNSQGQIASEKFKLLREVMDTLNKADLAISILDNNLLEAVRLWLEPLPDASMPSYQIQKELLQSLTTLPVKTDHLVASGIGKVLVFYQRSKRTEPTLKKIVDRLISEWTRPILNKSDSYKDRTIKFNDYNKSKYTNQLSSLKKNKTVEAKSLYEQQAERRNRAAIPSARTTAYKIAPKVDPSLLMRQQRGGEMFNRINRKMTNSKKKVVKKSGPSIEGKHLSM